MDRRAFERDRRNFGLPRALLRAGYYRANAHARARVYQLLVLTMGSVNHELLTRAVPYECRLLEPDEAVAFSRDRTNELPPRFVETAVARDDLCYGILDGSELASFGWYSREPTVVHDGLTVHFERGYLYMFHGYTKPSYRGQNLHGVGLARALALISSRGHEGIVTIAERVNFASLTSAHRVGYRDCGIAVHVGRGRGRVWTSPSPLPYGLGFERTGVHPFRWS